MYSNRKWKFQQCKSCKYFCIKLIISKTHRIETYGPYKMMAESCLYLLFPTTVVFSFSHSVISDSLWHYALQQASLLCPSPSPRACSNSCPSSQWCHALLLLPSILPSIRVFSNESVLFMKWPNYWSLSFSFSPSNEYSGLISFRMDWFDLLAVQGTLKSLLQFKSINSWVLSFLYRLTLTSIHDC